MRIFHDKPIAVGMRDSTEGSNHTEICGCGGAELYPVAVGSREVIRMSQVSVLRLLASRKGGILLVTTDDRQESEEHVSLVGKLITRIPLSGQLACQSRKVRLRDGSSCLCWCINV
ncbi:hypothetical protein MUK42_35136 [Musa troglodytarum]|uniref:Uncharacterized protein n=1 Tax=Musa troglodytarum TaxID=320322 RepID=A0A9E7FK08_9LILI|nr:hypothetical protein MUK42_35136 [Musa troglodytarum]